MVAAAAQSSGFQPASTAPNRPRFATVPIVAAARATRSGVLNVTANPNTPAKLATRRRPNSSHAGRAASSISPGVSPNAHATAQPPSAAARVIIAE